MYLCSNNFGKTAKLFMHYDKKNEMIHLMPFTFTDGSVSRVFIFLTNEESIQYFTKYLDKKMLHKPVAIYSLRNQTQDLDLYPVIFSKKKKAYDVEEDTFDLFEDKWYLPFVEEIAKQRAYNKLLEEED